MKQKNWVTTLLMLALLFISVQAASPIKNAKKSHKTLVAPTVHKSAPQLTRKSSKNISPTIADEIKTTLNTAKAEVLSSADRKNLSALQESDLTTEIKKEVLRARKKQVAKSVSQEGETPAGIMNPLQQTIYNRFVKYIAIETTSDPESSSVPTTKTQIPFARRLAAEMKRIGLSEVHVDKYGFVTGLLPANTDKKAPVIGLFAHMDTVSDFNGKNIRPVLHENYDGGTLTINQEKKMFLSPQNAPNLAQCKGDAIVTTDGNSILAGDDKIGIAIIMTFAEHLLQHPEIEHGPLKLAFTIDEETGTGIGHFDVKRFAADFAYTVDGPVLGEIDCGNFNGDGATINIAGKSCHPGYAKDVMANPVLIAADIVSSWPKDRLPETTEGEDGFVLFHDITGNSESAEVQAIVREHDLGRFEQFKKDLTTLVEEKGKQYPQASIQISFKKQYRNMRDILREQPQAMELLETSLKENNIDYHLTQVRGGTDGARLSFSGLPTPNIFAGYENPHGPYEWVSMNWAEKALHVLETIAKNAVK